MRIAITGANGQLGTALCNRLTPQHEIVPLNQESFDLERMEAIEQVAHTRAQLVMHTAAYTNVDGCARDPLLAYRVNTLGTKYVALACQQLDVPMVYISTNEIFSGMEGRAYMEYDQANPINAYGRSKWGGEQAVRELLHRFYIVRIAWLFGGERNFVRTIVRLGSNPPDGGLRVVTDEVGNPTYAPDLANALATLIEQPHYGTYHLVNSGHCSRYDFAREILRQAGYGDVPVEPILLEQYQRDSTPPPFTPLENMAGASLGIVLRPWQEALHEAVQHLG